MATDSEFVVEDYSPGVTGRIKGAWDAFQARLAQNIETVTRSAVIDIAGTGVEDIDAPEDIDQYHEQYQDTGIVRANLNQFVSDVTEPGIRVRADDDATQAFFMGETEDGPTPPDFTPRGGFLKNCAIVNETHQPFDGTFFKLVVLNRWSRGTNLIEYAKADLTDPESPITGFKLIPPETVSARAYNNTNLLLDPDPDADRNQGISPTLTPRDEVAAYIQFDEQSIIGRRFSRTNGTSGRDFSDEEDRPLSQNDVLKQVLDPDIGGADNESGIFGTSIIQSVTDEIAEYNEIKRDTAKAIKTKAYGIWDIEFETQVIETPDEAIIQEWDTDDQDEYVSDIGSLGPGEIIGHDAGIGFNRHEGSVPEVETHLTHLVEDILSPLPAPKFLTGFEDNVNRDVTSEQNPRYQQRIEEERTYQARSWTEAFREVARRHPDLDPTGIQALVQPKPEESPILSLDQGDIEKINTWVGAAATAAGPTVPPTALFDADFLRTEIFQVPESAAPEAVEEDTMARFDADARETFERVTGLDAYAEHWEAGDVVETPDGLGFVDDRITEGTVDGMDATSDDPVYAIGMVEEAGVNFFRGDELEDGELPTTDVDDPVKDVTEDEDTQAAFTEATAYSDVYEADVLQFGDFNYPPSWEDADTPARLILLDAWTSMGAQFDCGGGCCKGTMLQSGMSDRASDQFCASMKDAVLGTHDWRGGWAD